MKNNNLRGYESFQVLKNVSNPVMFLGLPMKLALFFLGAIMISAFMAMILKSFDVSIIVAIGVPSAFAFISISVIRLFYKKFGIKGFTMTTRNKNLPNDIRADKSVQQILKRK